MNTLILSLAIFAMITLAPELFSLLVSLFLMWVMAAMLGRWMFGGAGKYIPQPLKKMHSKPYGRRIAKEVYHYSYERQRERRGRVGGLTHVLLILTIILTLNYAFSWFAGMTITIPIFLWPTTLALFLLWRWKKKVLPPNWQLPERKRR